MDAPRLLARVVTADGREHRGRPGWTHRRTLALATEIWELRSDALERAVAAPGLLELEIEGASPALDALSRRDPLVRAALERASGRSLQAEAELWACWRSPGGRKDRLARSLYGALALRDDWKGVAALLEGLPEEDWHAVARGQAAFFLGEIGAARRHAQQADARGLGRLAREIEERTARPEALLPLLVQVRDDRDSWAVYGDYLASISDPRGPLLLAELRGEPPASEAELSALYQELDGADLWDLEGRAGHARVLKEWHGGDDELASSLQRVLESPAGRFVCELRLARSDPAALDVCRRLRHPLRTLIIGNEDWHRELCAPHEPPLRDDEAPLALDEVLHALPWLTTLVLYCARGPLGAIPHHQLERVVIVAETAPQMVPGGLPACRELWLWLSAASAAQEAALAALADGQLAPGLERLSLCGPGIVPLLDRLLDWPVLARLQELRVHAPISREQARALAQRAGAFAHLSELDLAQHPGEWIDPAGPWLACLNEPSRAPGSLGLLDRCYALALGRAPCAVTRLQYVAQGACIRLRFVPTGVLPGLSAIEAFFALLCTPESPEVDLLETWSQQVRRFPWGDRDLPESPWRVLDPIEASTWSSTLASATQIARWRQQTMPPLGAPVRAVALEQGRWNTWLFAQTEGGFASIELTLS